MVERTSPTQVLCLPVASLVLRLCRVARVCIRETDRVLMQGPCMWTVRLSMWWRRSGYLLFMTVSAYPCASVTLLTITLVRLL